jgi:hypothetical protein
MKKPEPIDMSPEAVRRRLEQVAELNRLMRYLATYEREHDVNWTDR